MRQDSVRTFEWTDRDTYETIRLVAKAYRLGVSAIAPSGPKRAVVALSGDEAALSRLSCDMRMLGRRSRSLLYVRPQGQNICHGFSPS